MGIGTLTPDGILKLVALQFNIPTADLRSSKNLKKLIMPRRIAAYLLRKHLLFSHPEIAKFLLLGDHTQAIHAVSRVAGELNKDEEFRKIVEAIENLIDAPARNSRSRKEDTVEITLKIPMGVSITLGNCREV